ncbi:MAG: hypothetical protein R3F13_18105 [Prosthecobacter sp.]
MLPMISGMDEETPFQNPRTPWSLPNVSPHPMTKRTSSVELAPASSSLPAATSSPTTTCRRREKIEVVVDVSGATRSYNAEVIGADPLTDVALIKINAPNLTPAVIGDSSRLRVSDIVLAAGAR